MPRVFSLEELRELHGPRSLRRGRGRLFALVGEAILVYEGTPDLGFERVHVGERGAKGTSASIVSSILEDAAAKECPWYDAGFCRIDGKPCPFTADTYRECFKFREAASRPDDVEKVALW